MTEEQIESVLRMREAGFNASEQEQLPFLFKEVYGFELPKCSDCRIKAWESLYRDATRKRKYELSMSYRIKKEYHGSNFVFIHQGKRILVNHENLTDERAQWMLGSEYAHAIEGQPDKVEVFPDPKESEVVTASTSPNQKADGKPQVKTVKGKLSKSKG